MACGHDLSKPVQPLPQVPAQESTIDYSHPYSYTPKHLAEKILASRASVEGERKLVTVLFADVVNSTAIFEYLDPEDVHNIMDGCIRILLDNVHFYEGTINQFRGDGVMALFGAPIAHEDHAQRACYSALSIQNAIKTYATVLKKDYDIEFQMRVGINSGPVVVGAIGDDLRMDYTAEGHTSNLASRLEGMAKPDSIMVSNETYRLAEEFFRFQPLGQMNIRGISRPQDTYELISVGTVETRIDASVAKGLTRWVGRSRSMNKLKEVYAKIVSDRGQVVAIAGEPGVGKSRLLLEYVKSLPEDEVTYLEGRCLPYGKAIAYLPVIDILKSYLGIKESDAKSVMKKKLTDKIMDLDNRLTSVIAPFEEMLSLDVDDKDFLKLNPQEKRERTFEAIKNTLAQMNQGKPIVLAIEDLHWIDKTSEEFIEYLIEWIDTVPILLILLYRLEYTHGWEDKPYYTQLRLNQLTNASSIKLAKVLLAGKNLSPELNELIISRASGNPLFIEEFTRALLDSDAIEEKNNTYVLKQAASEIQVPYTIQGLIASRMDRLEEDTKRTMQYASVIGRDFAFRILKAITDMREELDSYLSHLQTLEFVYKKRLFPELEYIFKHALTQEVAYNSLLVGRRKVLHRTVGEAIESLFSDRLTEFAGIVGEHFLRGEAWERAFFYLSMAGEAALRLFANAEARTHFLRALKALSQLEDSKKNRRNRIDTIIQLTVSSWRSDSPEQNLKRLTKTETLAKTLTDSKESQRDDTLRLARINFWLGRVHYSRGEMAQAINYFKKVLPVAQKAGDAELIAIPSGAIGQVMAVQGRFEEGSKLLGQAIQLFEQSATWADWSHAMSFYGTAIAGMGQYNQGVEIVKQAIQKAREMKILAGRSVSYNCLGFTYLFGGDYPHAINAGGEAIEAARQSGDRIYVYVGHGIRSWAEARHGQLEAAMVDMANCQEIAQELGGQIIMADLFASARAEIAYLMDQIDDALNLSEQAVAIAQKTGGVLAEGIARRFWGLALAGISSPDWDQADTQIETSLRLLASGKNRLEMARTHMAAGHIWQKQGNFTKAREHFETAADAFESSGITPELQDARMRIEAL